MKSFREPTLEEAMRMIDDLKANDLRSVTVEDLVKRFTPLLAGHMVVAPIIPAGTLLFRARRLADKPGSVTDLSYPPGPGCSLGRANRPGKPILYCTTGRGPCFLELRSAPSDRVAIITYKTLRDFVVQRVGYTEAAFSNIGAKRDFRTITPTDIVVRTRASRYIDEFFSDLFTEIIDPREPWRYSMTVALAEKLLTGFDFDGLVYPSVATWANADNVAVQPKTALWHLQPVRMEYTEVSRVDKDEIVCEVLDEARSFGSSGRIDWLGHPAKWVLRKQGEQVICRSNGHYWEAFDDAGNIVAPE